MGFRSLEVIRVKIQTFCFHQRNRKLSLAMSFVNRTGSTPYFPDTIRSALQLLYW